MKNHYDTLGVLKNATKKEIKDTYRRLSLQYHPDTASSKKHICRKTAEERFKLISNAYGVLSNDLKRKEYDELISQETFLYPNMRQGPYDHFHQNNQYQGAKNSFHSSRAEASVHFRKVESFFRPKNLMIGVTAGYFIATLANWMYQEKKKEIMVEAWKNHSTGKWEQPAPWDDYYRTAKPQLKLVPRHLVQRRDR